jgi:RNA polymerase sigma-70 factor, ECF subfamily
MPAVRRLTHAILGSGNGQDATQETFLRALASLESFDPARGQVRTWFLGIARNVAFEALRAQRRVELGSAADLELFELAQGAGWGAEPTEPASPEREAMRTETQDQLLQALASLAPEDREVLVLRDFEGLDGEHAAAVLGVDLPAMKSRLHRARLRLMATMRSLEEGIVARDREVSGMRCSDVIAVLSDYLDGDLGATDRARVESHVQGCTVCARFGGHFAGTIEHLRARLGAPPAVDPEQVAALKQRLAVFVR